MKIDLDKFNLFSNLDKWELAFLNLFILNIKKSFLSLKISYKVGKYFNLRENLNKKIL